MNVETGHGRARERRKLIASTGLTAYLDWPGLAQVFRIERIGDEHGTTNRAVHYSITSLSPQTGPPDRLFALKRGHWGNREPVAPAQGRQGASEGVRLTPDAASGTMARTTA